MVMRFKLVLFSILLFLSSCQGQPDSSMQKALKEDAESMSKALIRKDYITFVKYINPKILEMQGGEDKMIQTLIDGESDLEAKHSRILSVTFGKPTRIIKHNGELQCTMVQSTEIKVPQGRTIVHSNQVAISTDNGRHWHFLDLSGTDIEHVRRTFPNLSNELEIKEIKPTFISE